MRYKMILVLLLRIVNNIGTQCFVRHICRALLCEICLVTHRRRFVDVTLVDHEWIRGNTRRASLLDSGDNGKESL